MSAEKPNRSTSAWTLTASALTQLLAGVACFLAAFVLPHSYPDLRGMTSSILLVAGTVALILGIGNILYGRRLTRFMMRVGMRSRVVVPREGVVYLGIMLMLAVAALLGHREMLLLLFGMMAGAFVINGWVVYLMLKGIAVVRHVPRRATAGEPVTVEIVADNKKKLITTRMLEVRDAIAGVSRGNHIRDAAGIATFVRVPRRESRTCRYRVRFALRGIYRFGPMRISSRFPLGIGERASMVSDTNQLIVHPEVGTLLPSWKRQQRELAESAVRSNSMLGIFDDEFHRIREFRSNDNPRAIHWRSTARNGELMVREYEQNRQADVFILLDLRASKAFPKVDQEKAISLVATMCLDQSRTTSGGRFLLVVGGQTTDVIASQSSGSFRDGALDALAVCQPSPKADFSALLQRAIEFGAVNAGRGILVTPRPVYAALAIPEVASQLVPDKVDLLSRMTIVEATSSAMDLVFRVQDPRPAAGTKPEDNGVAAGGAK